MPLSKRWNELTLDKHMYNVYTSGGMNFRDRLNEYFDTMESLIKGNKYHYGATVQIDGYTAKQLGWYSDREELLDAITDIRVEHIKVHKTTVTQLKVKSYGR